jgi:hypothetical protein
MMADRGADDDFAFTERQNQARPSRRFSTVLTQLKKILIIGSRRDNSAWKRTSAQAAFDHQSPGRIEGSSQ